MRALHDLDLLDKHNDLIPTLALAAQTNDLRVGNFLMSENKIDLKEGRVLLSYPGIGAALMMPMPLRLCMRFGDDQPFAQSEIVPVLNRLTEQISGIVEAFAALYKR